MKTDKLVYLLFQKAPQGFFTLVGRSAEDAAKYEFKSIEIKETAFRLDDVFTSIDANEPTYFVEAQFQLDDEFYGRFFAEIFLYLKQYRVSQWHAVVIFPSRSTEQTEFGAYQGLLDTGLIRRIYLDELPEMPQAEAAIGLFKLLIEPESTAPSSARAVLQKAPEYLDIVHRILSYKFSNLKPKKVSDMLGLNEEFLKETQYYKDIFNEGKLEGELKGELKGKLEVVPLLRQVGLSDDVIAEKLNLPLGSVQAVPRS